MAGERWDWRLEIGARSVTAIHIAPFTSKKEPFATKNGNVPIVKHACFPICYIKNGNVPNTEGIGCIGR